MVENIHIIVFTGRHPVLSFFIEQFVKHLDNKGIEYYLVDVDHPESYNCADFIEFASRNNTCAFMYNNIGLGMLTSEGDSFWKAHNIPVFDYLVDHPRNFGDSLRSPMCDIYAFALDLEHVEFMKAHYTGVKGVYFSPNGGTEIDHGIPYTERTIDVIYMGECNPTPDSFPFLDIDKINFDDYYRTTIETMMADPGLSTDEVIEGYLDSKGIELSESEKYSLICLTSRAIEDLMRHKTKMDGMKALDDAGIHVEIYGNTWIDSECPFSDNIVIHNRIDIKELLPKTANAKIALCFMPWFKKGCSEKNFDAMLNGAVCVTDSSEYLRKNYKDGYNIVYFDLNNPSQMAADIKWLLDNPDIAQGIAKRGYETCIKYDTWNNRFDFVISKMLDVINQP